MHVLYALKTSLVCLFILFQSITFAYPSYHPKASNKGPASIGVYRLLEAPPQRFSTYVDIFEVLDGPITLNLCVQYISNTNNKSASYDRVVFRWFVNKMVKKQDIYGVQDEA